MSDKSVKRQVEKEFLEDTPYEIIYEEPEFDPDTEENTLEDKLLAAGITLSRYVSMSDIEAANMNWNKLNRKDKNNLLWSMGLDIERHRYVTSKDLHINLQNQKVECIRMIGSERLDDSWLKGGYASFEAKLAAKGDVSLVSEINAMGKYADSIPSSGMIAETDLNILDEM